MHSVQTGGTDTRGLRPAHPAAAILGLDTQDSDAGARAFYARYGLHFPSISDRNGHLAAQFSGGLPTTGFLDREHRIAWSVDGPVSRAQLERGLKLVSR